MHLSVTRLSKTYPNGVQALRDVSLDIPPGMFGLLGPNGAGKSTFMRILATLQDADTGSARLGVHEITFTVDERPREVAVDPDVLLIDRIPDDNLKGVAGGG